MAQGKGSFFHHYRDEPGGLEGVTGGRPGPEGGGRGLLGGEGSFPEWRGVLGVQSSMVWVEGALRVEGACWPSSPTSMACSLSVEASDGSSSEGREASG